MGKVGIIHITCTLAIILITAFITACSATTTPAGPEDWTAHDIDPRDSTYQTGSMIDFDGRPLTACSLYGTALLRLAWADISHPQETATGTSWLQLRFRPFPINVILRSSMGFPGRSAGSAIPTS